MTHELLIDELARVFWQAEQAVLVARLAGFPVQSMPAFKLPRVFWSTVIEAASNGMLPGGVQPIAAAALHEGGANLVFETYASD